MPVVSVECGAPAPDRLRNTLVSRPAGSLAFLARVILIVLLMYFAREQFRSRVLMCSRHVGHRRKRISGSSSRPSGPVLLAVRLGVLTTAVGVAAKEVPLVVAVSMFDLVGWVVTIVFVRAGTIRIA